MPRKAPNTLTETSHPAACEICGAPLSIDSVVPGYQEPASYTILRCDGCHTMVSSPKRLDARVYDAIYALPGGPPGYDRNFQYARAVTRVKDPMSYLASRQDAFWGVQRGLSGKRGTRILEVGAGLGYFTYALRRAGYDAIGIDVSEEAVSRARSRFGKFYLRESVESYSVGSDEKFDAIVMVEVIEHLENPVSVVESALRLLAPGGSLIATTPNRSYFGDDAPWTTDLPPVHLWWFSEESVTAIGKQLGCEVSLVDFTEYNSAFPVLYTYKPPREPMFDSAGRLTRVEPLPVALARRLGVLQETYWLASRAAGFLRRQASSRRPTMVARFTPRSYA